MPWGTQPDDPRHIKTELSKMGRRVFACPGDFSEVETAGTLMRAVTDNLGQVSAPMQRTSSF